MKVALIHMRQRGTGGTERYLNQVAPHLASHGHEVTIVCRSHESPPHPDVRFVVLRPFAFGGAWRMWSFARAVAHHVRQISYDLVFALGKTWSHDVIRLGGGCHQTYLDLAHQATLGPWERLAGGGRLKHRLALEIERRALAPGAYAHVITNSEMVRRDVVQRHGVPGDQVTVIYNGVDLQRFHPRRRAAEGVALRGACGILPADFVVLFLGTGYGRKGLGPLLAAFPGFLAQRANARLLVVGYDSAQASFEDQTRRMGLDCRVIFLGGRRDAEACFAAADLYVLPTRYDPFANTTLEALASGVPVLTTAVNGASELLTHHVHGSILSSNPAAREIQDELLFWSDLSRIPLAKTAARVLAERHSSESTVEATSSVLESVAAGRAANTRRAVGDVR